MMRVSRAVNSALPGSSPNPGAMSATIGGASQTPRLFTRLGGEGPGEDGHERRGHRAFGEQFAQQARDPIRDIERIGDVAGAGSPGPGHGADDAEHAAEEG